VELCFLCRPDCRGQNYTIIPEPFTIAEYYDLSSNMRIYTCHCTPGISGDHCEGCEEVDGLYRYRTGNGCRDCGCSDLVSSKQCDKTTGQCPCTDGGNGTGAGRQCVSIQSGDGICWILEELLNY